MFTCDCSCRTTLGLRPDPAVRKGPRGRCCSPGTPGMSSCPQCCCLLEPKRNKHVSNKVIEVATIIEWVVESFWLKRCHKVVRYQPCAVEVR